MTKKKVLIITYYWPPAGGPGVQRWLKFVKYLPHFGIHPIVYCPENPNYPIVDDTLQNDIPETITVIKAPIKEPYAFAKLFSKKDTASISSGIIPKEKRQTVIQRLMLYIRGNFFIPDARKMWIKPSTEFLAAYINEHHVDTIITTGPPHSLHLIGLHLKRQFNLRWIADFRDPWTTIGYHELLKLTAASKDKHNALECEVLNSADHIIVTSNYTKSEFTTKTDKPITMITNGYDIHTVARPDKDQSFTMAHIGSLLSERNPDILWSILSELVEENKSFKDLFLLRLIGVVSSDIIDKLESYSLRDNVEVIGYVTHEEAINYQMKSQVLLLIETDSEATKAIIPGKLFEYIVSETPILAIGPEDSDIQTILKSTQTGTYFTYKQKAALKMHVLDLFEAYLNNTLDIKPVNIEQYSRKELTGKLAALL
jgi:glycosyltransferase involved in cell wall biosynthesis